MRAVIAITRGEPDVYHNQHLRFVALNLTVMFIAAGSSIVVGGTSTRRLNVQLVVLLGAAVAIGWTIASGL